MKRGTRVWVEDDALHTARDPDRTTIVEKWRELFHEEYDSREAVEVREDGDCVWRRMPNGYIVCSAFDGDALYRPAGES